ncbi:MAG: type IV pilus twitching motility protein PilT [Candidatus Gracilibacteria bacterium]|nr:type IV pilus twitching motility protein PilT [Candidatus Gracilibacteria bacterium]
MNAKEQIDLILNYASENNYSDVHINSNSSIRVRNNNGEIEIVKDFGNGKIEILSKESVIEIIKVLLGEEGYNKFISTKEMDSSYMITNGDRYRVNCYIDSLGYSIAFRIIPSKIPTLEELGLGEQIKEMCNKSKGLILITGPTGSGKSTNMAAMIDYINKNHKKHIITIEDPIEFSFKSDKSLINQREIGNHTIYFGNAMKSSLREDPDVIMVGEMRDPETIKTAITLAETGHLVLSTLHTNDSVQTIDRIIDIFPGSQQAQIRMQLSQSLVGVISQRLIPRDDKPGRIPAREILISDDAVRNLIITGKTHQLYSVLEVGKNKGMILMDKYLLALHAKNIITKETLLSYVRDKESISMMLD